MSRTVDHAEELQDGGSLTDLDNLWTAHLGCNSSKGAARRHERERAVKAEARALPLIAIDPATL
jgi:5-methylcytosine-specific restriction endonuclease McrA